MADPREIGVRVVALGRSVVRLRCPVGASVADVLRLAGVDPAGKDLHVDGRPAALDAVVADGAVVTAIPRVRGGRAA